MTLTTKIVEAALAVLGWPLRMKDDKEREPLVGELPSEEFDWIGLFVCDDCGIVEHGWIRWQPYDDLEAECLDCGNVSEIEPL